MFLSTAPSTATSSKSLAPTSYPVGSTPGYALVVYDPGSTGSAKSIASEMASDLQAQGYFVNLAGIDSTMAKGNGSQYQVVIVGDPINDGKATSSVQSFLRNLNPGNGTEIGVFGVGSSYTPNDQIALLPEGSTLTIKETLEISPSQDTTTESAEFVTQLLS